MRTRKAYTADELAELCVCGHAMTEHYMCGSPDSMGCYLQVTCGCKQYCGPYSFNRQKRLAEKAATPVPTGEPKE